MAKWSAVWDEWKGGFTTRKERDSLIRQARFEAPLIKVKKGGKYPHLQRFRQYTEVKNG